VGRTGAGHHRPIGILAATGPSPSGYPASDDPFGTRHLGRYFARVEHRDTEAYTLWESRENLQAFLDAFIELMGPTVAPEGPYPFRVTRRNRVYIAEKAFSPTPTG